MARLCGSFRVWIRFRHVNECERGMGERFRLKGEEERMLVEECWRKLRDN